jgi:hypothetical protein
MISLYINSIYASIEYMVMLAYFVLAVSYGCKMFITTGRVLMF